MSDTEKLAVAVQALRDIVDPIGMLRRKTPPDCELDGFWAVKLTEYPSTYQTIARDALAVVAAPPPADV